MQRNLEFERKWEYNPNVNYIEVVKTYNELIAQINSSEEEEKKESRKVLHQLCKEHGGNICLVAKLDYYTRLHGLSKVKL